MNPLMIQGTGSHAGKSFLATALCRIFFRRGIGVAPFKAQNMANNAAAVHGGEIGRAQAIQAAAARVAADVRMNPLLLKPTADRRSQVILMGKPAGTFSVREIDRRKPVWFQTIRAAFRSLSKEHEMIVIEGAGSPAEINLHHADYANMRVAAMSGADVLMVGDIDRGGVFASLFGTMSLLRPSERGRVMGLCINKFRGDPSLLSSGLRFLRARTGKKVLGVIPYDTELRLPEEDSLGLDVRGHGPRRANQLTIGFIRFPRISNFTDLDPFRSEPDVHIRTISSPADLKGISILILPGSKNVFADMEFLEKSGLARSIRHMKEVTVVGICGGYQMLGHRIVDGHGVESSRPGTTSGLGLLPVSTRFKKTKIVRPVRLRHKPSGTDVTGYEIHHGRMEYTTASVRSWFHGPTGEMEGAVSADGRIMGSATHGLFDSDKFRNAFLNQARRRAGLPARPPSAYDLNAIIDRAADLVESHLDIHAILRKLKKKR